MTLHAALEHGFTLDELRHPGFHRPFRGLRSVTEPGPTLLERTLYCSALLREVDRFSHLSALALYGCPIRANRDEPVHIESRYGSGTRRLRGVRGHSWRESKANEERILRIDGSRIRLASPTRALLQCASLLPFNELVIAIDHLIRGDARRRPAITLEHLFAFAAKQKSLAGERLRRATRVARVGAESRMETLTRLAGVAAGLGELSLQLDLFDASGSWIGRFDLVDPKSRNIFEYDGEQHRTKRSQYLRDQHRLDRVRAERWTVIRFHSEDVVHRFRETGLRMLEATGRPPLPVDPTLARLLAEPLPATHVSVCPRNI